MKSIRCPCNRCDLVKVRLQTVGKLAPGVALLCWGNVCLGEDCIHCKLIVDCYIFRNTYTHPFSQCTLLQEVVLIMIFFFLFNIIFPFCNKTLHVNISPFTSPPFVVFCSTKYIRKHNNVRIYEIFSEKKSKTLLKKCEQFYA